MDIVARLYYEEAICAKHQVEHPNFIGTMASTMEIGLSKSLRLGPKHAIEIQGSE